MKVIDANILSGFIQNSNPQLSLEEMKQAYINSFTKTPKRIRVSEKNFHLIMEREESNYMRIVQENKKKKFLENGLKYSENDLIVSQDELVAYFNQNPEALQQAIDNLGNIENEEDSHDNLFFDVQITFSKMFFAVLCWKLQLEFINSLNSIPFDTPSQNSSPIFHVSLSPAPRVSVSPAPLAFLSPTPRVSVSPVPHSLSPIPKFLSLSHSLKKKICLSFSNFNIFFSISFKSFIFNPIS
jgi:hypothetical protein